MSTISGCGSLEADDPNTVRVVGGNLVARLLQRTSVRFAKRSKKFLDTVNRLPFVFGERSLNSVLLPSLGDCADAVTTEYPVRRRRTRGQGSGFGFLDYWVFHNHRLMMIEVKQVWLNPSTRSVTDRVRRNWSVAIRQTDRIPLTSIREDLNEMSLDASSVFRVPLLVAPFISTSGEEERIDYDRRILVYRHETLRNELSPRPNFSTLWLLKHDFQGPYPWWSGPNLRHATFPAVGFYTWIHRRG